MSTIKVRITGHSGQWYEDKIGTIFEVDSSIDTVFSNKLFRLTSGQGVPAGYGIHTHHCEVVQPETKLFRHEGVDYVVPEWAKFVTFDGVVKGGSPYVFGWGKKPKYEGEGRGFRNDGEDENGEWGPLEKYVPPEPVLPEGAFIVEV